MSSSDNEITPSSRTRPDGIVGGYRGEGMEVLSRDLDRDFLDASLSVSKVRSIASFDRVAVSPIGFLTESLDEWVSGGSSSEDNKMITGVEGKDFRPLISVSLVMEILSDSKSNHLPV
jgi:hypothetical protein